jgi:hypothetical protein
MPTVSEPRKSGRGGLTRLVLVLLLVGGVMVAVLALAAPWGFFMGGRFHAIPMWQGVGRIDSNRAGGGYAVYVWFWPDHGRLRNLGYVQGNASCATPVEKSSTLPWAAPLKSPRELTPTASVSACICSTAASRSNLRAQTGGRNWNCVASGAILIWCWTTMDRWRATLIMTRSSMRQGSRASIWKKSHR